VANHIEADVVCCTRTRHARGDEERSALPTLVVPRRGVFRYASRTGAAVADANTALLFHPDEPYCITHPTDDGDDCIALRFDRETVTDALGARGLSAQVWLLDARRQRALQRHARKAVAAGDELERAEWALAALSAVACDQPAAARRDAARIDTVRERIAANAAAPSSLQTLARDVGLSPYYLARRFRARTGTSMHQYRLALRLALAHGMLQAGADDVTHVALECGFSSHAHFGAAFRRAYGYTPRATRLRS
jgi:AraC-like DNA-binding protein